MFWATDGVIMMKTMFFSFMAKSRKERGGSFLCKRICQFVMSVAGCITVKQCNSVNSPLCLLLEYLHGTTQSLYPHHQRLFFANLTCLVSGNNGTLRSAALLPGAGIMCGTSFSEGGQQNSICHTGVWSAGCQFTNARDMQRPLQPSKCSAWNYFKKLNKN